jgi:hypothetical protein
MGEIKSTLDIVLEKTKNLKLTSAEKAEQQQKEVVTRLRALLQKYQDGVLTQDDLVTEFRLLQKDFNLEDSTDLVNEIFRRIDPDRDNHALLELLDRCCHIHPARIAAVISDFQAACDSAARNRMHLIKEALARKFSISGSAVVPNLAVDEPWRQELQALRAGFERQLNQEKRILLSEA